MGQACACTSHTKIANSVAEHKAPEKRQRLTAPASNDRNSEGNVRHPVVEVPTLQRNGSATTTSTNFASPTSTNFASPATSPILSQSRKKRPRGDSSIGDFFGNYPSPGDSIMKNGYCDNTEIQISDFRAGSTSPTFSSHRKRMLFADCINIYRLPPPRSNSSNSSNSSRTKKRVSTAPLIPPPTISVPLTHSVQLAPSISPTLTPSLQSTAYGRGVSECDFDELLSQLESITTPQNQTSSYVFPEFHEQIDDPLLSTDVDKTEMEETWSMISEFDTSARKN